MINKTNSLSPNPKDYDNTIDEGEDKQFPPNDNFRGTYMGMEGDEFHNYVQNDHGEDNIHPNDNENAYREDNEMMEMFQANIRSRPFHINPKQSSYTMDRIEYLKRRRSINELISSECCQKDYFKHGFQFCIREKEEIFFNE